MRDLKLLCLGFFALTLAACKSRGFNAEESATLNLARECLPVQNALAQITILTTKIVSGEVSEQSITSTNEYASAKNLLTEYYKAFYTIERDPKATVEKKEENAAKIAVCSEGFLERLERETNNQEVTFGDISMLSQYAGWVGITGEEKQEEVGENALDKAMNFGGGLGIVKVSQMGFMKSGLRVQNLSSFLSKGGTGAQGNQSRLFYNYAKKNGRFFRPVNRAAASFAGRYSNIVNSNAARMLSMGGRTTRVGSMALRGGGYSAAIVGGLVIGTAIGDAFNHTKLGKELARTLYPFASGIMNWWDEVPTKQDDILQDATMSAVLFLKGQVLLAHGIKTAKPVDLLKPVSTIDAASSRASGCAKDDQVRFVDSAEGINVRSGAALSAERVDGLDDCQLVCFLGKREGEFVNVTYKNMPAAFKELWVSANFLRVQKRTNCQ